MTNEEMIEIVKKLFREKKRLLEYIIQRTGADTDREELECVALAEAKFLEMVGAEPENGTKVFVENHWLI